MPDSQIEIKNKTIELTANAFDAFCDDISGMFGISMKCVKTGISTETTKSLSQKYKKLASITLIKSEGSLNGTFHTVFDQAGLFTLAGIIIMLPKQKIIDDIKRGTVKDAEAIADTIKEAGNLFVGSWDRIFREELEGHGHFLQGGTYIGNPWDKPVEKIGITDTEEFQYVSFQMTIEDYPVFNCGAFFPEAVFVKPVIPQPPPVVEVTEAAKTEQVPPPQPEKAIVEDKPIIIENKEPDLGPVSETIKQMIKSTPQAVSSLAALKLSAKDIMQTQVLFGTAEDSVQQALTKMQQAQCNCMIIGKDNLPEGIITTYDLTSAISIYLKPVFAKWRRPTDDATLQIKLKWIMTRPVRTVKSDTQVSAVMETICQTGVRCLPVVGAHGKVEGLITVFDIFQALLQAESENQPTNKPLEPTSSAQ
ncbi:MAG: hypothetical protein A2Y12_12150 [Planctomycetes bacterium GWF2_42_9]|nr:MAG: hypothetical protein A2Y12_12150 [Planctomycetes bacterium GWF2_42_9]